MAETIFVGRDLSGLVNYRQDDSSGESDPPVEKASVSNVKIRLVQGEVGTHQNARIATGSTVFGCDTVDHIEPVEPSQTTTQG